MLNTPWGNSGPRVDGYEIRTAAVQAGIVVPHHDAGVRGRRAGHRGALARRGRRAVAAGPARHSWREWRDDSEHPGAGARGRDLRGAAGRGVRPVHRRRAGHRRGRAARPVRRRRSRRRELADAAAPRVRALRRDAVAAISPGRSSSSSRHTGPGTRWLVNRRAGDRIDVVGPLGQPFPVPSGPAPAVLVGGGYGTAPLIPLAQRCWHNGSRGRVRARRGHRGQVVRRADREAAARSRSR